MTVEQQTVMTGAETDALLERRETGVLALARADEPYAIPISYGYDADVRRFCMRLVSAPESEKRRFLSDAPEVRFVVYEEDGTTYRSAIANGRLERLHGRSSPRNTSSSTARRSDRCSRCGRRRRETSTSSCTYSTPTN
jgi:nitroimidazol reductase NimA-like FMN-containing flavoprotein (pyridoxamine 5'-phosphate oxidase superfamily)